MVSRSNLSERAPYGGILGMAYKGPSGPGKITPPGMEGQVSKRGTGLLGKRDPEPVEAGGVAVPGIVEAGPRVGLTPPVKPQLQDGLSGIAQGMRRKKEVLAEQRVTPAIDPILAGQQPEVGGNVSRGTPMRGGSAAAKARRINR